MPATFVWEPDPMVYADSIAMVAGALEDARPPLAAASVEMQHSIRDAFETETAPDGSPWELWADSYAPVAEAFPNEGILRQTGALEKAATSSEAYRIANNTLFFETPVLPHYGLAHNEGMPDRKNPLPKREFIGLSEQSQQVIYGDFFAWFEDAISLYPTSTGKLGRRHSFRAVPGGFFLPASEF